MDGSREARTDPPVAGGDRRDPPAVRPSIGLARRVRRSRRPRTHDVRGGYWRRNGGVHTRLRRLEGHLDGAQGFLQVRLPDETADLGLVTGTNGDYDETRVVEQPRIELRETLLEGSA